MSAENVFKFNDNKLLGNKDLEALNVLVKNVYSQH